MFCDAAVNLKIGDMLATKVGVRDRGYLEFLRWGKKSILPEDGEGKDTGSGEPCRVSHPVTDRQACANHACDGMCCGAQLECMEAIVQS